MAALSLAACASTPSIDVAALQQRDAAYASVIRFADAPAAWQALLDRGVLVRDVGLPGWLRVTAGTAEETDAFLTALGEVVPILGPALGDWAP